jgi:hypothetical protein
MGVEELDDLLFGKGMVVGESMSTLNGISNPPQRLKETLWIRDPREGVHGAGRYRPLTVEGANLYELIVRANDRKTRRDDALKPLICHLRICSSRKHTSIRRDYERGSTEPGVWILSKSPEGKELASRKIFYRLITSSEHTDDIEVTL